MTALRHRSPPFWHRLFAGLGVALVLALGVFGANADLHGILHGEDHGHDHGHASAPASSRDDGCAVVLLATGATVPVDVPAGLGAPELTWLAERPVTAGAAVARRLDYRLPPGQAPPSA